MAERIKMAVAALIAAGGLVAFYVLGDRALIIRLAALLGCFGAAVALMGSPRPGAIFVAFARESWEEAKRVVWPTRKETLQTTGVVFLFVFTMALFLWIVDTGLLWITQKLLGTGGLNMTMRWYVVHAYSGQEKSIQAALIDRIKRSGMADKFGQVLVPTEEVVEMKSGQKAISERRFFPGYILVQMDMTDETWHLVKSTPKVTGFIGGSAMRPTPISDKEVENILHQVQEGVEKPKPKVLFEVGENVRVTEGPFTDFNGNVEEVNYEKSKIRVSVLIFGRATPVELDFGQVEKA